MIRVALYARYSDARQNPLSCDDQLKVCSDHAARRGWTVVAMYRDDAISGAAMANRPGLQALIAAAEAGVFDVVLVEAQDRLARNLEHEAHVFNRFKRAGVRIATLSTDEVKIIDVAFKGLMNELYLEALGEKTRRGMTANAEKGLSTGAKVYGYASAPGGALQIVADEAAVIVRAHELYADGMSGREIADRFNAERIPGPKGGAWNASTLLGNVARGNGVLRAELYAGVKVWNRNLVKKDASTGRRIHLYRPPEEWRRTPVEHLRIVPAELWERSQARLGEVSGVSLAARGNSRSRGVFSGLLKCGQCGASYTSYSKKSLVCAAYREKGPSYCSNGKYVARELVDRRILDGLQARMLSPAAVRRFAATYQAVMARLAAERANRRRPLERRLGELTRGLERLLDLMLASPASAALAERLAAMEAEKAAVVAELAAQADDGPDVAIHPSTAEGLAAKIGRLRDVLVEIATDPTEASANRKLIDAVRGLVIKIEILPDAAEAGGFRLRMHGNLAKLMTPETKKAPAVVGEGLDRRAVRTAGILAGAPNFALGAPMVAGGRYQRAPSAIPVVFEWPARSRAA